MIRMGLPVRWAVVAEDIRHLQRRSHGGGSGGRGDRIACGVSCGLQTIQWAGSGAHFVGGEAQIFCRGVETAMTKQQLDGAQIGAGLEKMDGKGVPTMSLAT
jgi:hypothetical protein